MIKIWNLNNFTCHNTLTDSHLDNYVWSLCIIQNGDLASGYQDGTIKIWNKDDFHYKEKLSHQNNDNDKELIAVGALCLLNNGDFASGSDDKSIKIWNNKSNFYECE